MLLSVDSASDQPIFEQIADAIRREIAVGSLRSGEKLPAASAIAAGLSVNKHTVLHAYQALREEGLIDLRRGRGAVVTQLADQLSELHRETQSIANRARSLGISPNTLAALFASIPAPALPMLALPTPALPMPAVPGLVFPATELPATEQRMKVSPA